MNEKAALLGAIVALVDQFKADGSVVDAEAVAEHLSYYYPESGLLLDQIVLEVQRNAALRGAQLAPRRSDELDELYDSPDFGTPGMWTIPEKVL
jgi:Tfp pilus assembly PilM family ATPase